MDRLSALMERFELQVETTPLAEANFVIAEPIGQPDMRKVFLAPAGSCLDQVCKKEEVVFTAQVSWGGLNNPFFAALPDLVELEIDDQNDAKPLLDLLLAEFNVPRCGSQSVLSRLSEILVVRLLRSQIEQGETSTSLVGGLADKRLSRAIVAIHDQPGKNWSNHNLAEIAGLSVSRFSEVFKSKVGETPAAYIRKWRLTLARQDIAHGDRIQEVAFRYCYKSAEALNHAFKQAYGINPTALRGPTSLRSPAASRIKA
jgi:AraC-like DNA-binding protein